MFNCNEPFIRIELVWVELNLTFEFVDEFGAIDNVELVYEIVPIDSCVVPIASAITFLNAAEFSCALNSVVVNWFVDCEM